MNLIGSIQTVKYSIENCKHNMTEKVCSSYAMVLHDSCRCYNCHGASPCPMFIEDSMKCMLDRIEVVR